MPLPGWIRPTLMNLAPKSMPITAEKAVEREKRSRRTERSGARMTWRGECELARGRASCLASMLASSISISSREYTGRAMSYQRAHPV
eukprot:scaffold303089_cov32-Tisochrysis_lutea.AAC.6